MAGSVVLLIDESAAMNTPIARPANLPMGMDAPAKSKADSVATAINSLFGKLADGPDLDVALIGYRSDADGNVDIGPRWGGGLAGRDFVPVSELATAPLEVEQRTRKVPQPDGSIQEESVDFNVWYKPELGEKAPQVAAFEYCRELLSGWSDRTTDAEAPMLIHITAGSSGDGNPLRAVQGVQQLEIGGESPLLFQVHLSSSDTLPPVLYPANRAYLALGLMRDTFERASLLPEHLVAPLKAAKIKVNPKARGMIYNAKMLDLTHLLSLVQEQAKQWQTTESPAAEPALEEPAETEPVPEEPVPEEPALETSPEAAVEEPLAAGDLEEETTAGDEAATVLSDESELAASEEDLAASGGEDLLSEPAEEAPAETPGAELGPVSPDQPALVMFVLDRSVEDPYSGDLQNVCTKLQEQMGDLVASIAKTGGGAVDVSVVSYGVDGMGEPDIRTALEGSLAGQTFARDTDLETGAARVDEFEEEVSNGVGGLISIPRKRVILVEVEPTEAAPASGAFAEAAKILSGWVGDHPTSNMPPILLHLTRGQLEAGDVQEAVGQLQSIATPSGNSVVVYHLVTTESEHPAVAYPDSDAELQDPQLQALWELSSPPLFADQLGAEKSISPQSRGIVVNGKFDLLLDAIKRASSEEI